MLSTNLNDVILLLENCTGQRTLAAVIQPIGVCPVLKEKPDEVGVAMIRRQHELSCPVSLSQSFLVHHTDSSAAVEEKKRKGREGRGRAGM